ncbi:MAG: HPr family phosphocarrier protein [Lachnospiraceae bacterium]|nr:HPr family phosphocarrier protein [Lachnospiraceae bacterium]
MVSQKVYIKNPTGLHLRPAGVLCREALRCPCSVKLQCKDGIANAKSVLSVLGACIKSGDEITIICDGQDEEKALAEIVALIESGLGEN